MEGSTRFRVVRECEGPVQKARRHLAREDLESSNPRQRWYDQFQITRPLRHVQCLPGVPESGANVAGQLAAEAQAPVNERLEPVVAPSLVKGLLVEVDGRPDVVTSRLGEPEKEVGSLSALRRQVQEPLQ